MEPHVKEITIADVGASGGIHERWKQFSNHTNFLTFDPLIQPADFHNTHKATFFNSAIAGYNGKGTINICRKKDVSSLLTPNMALLEKYPQSIRFDILQTQETDVWRLDTLCEIYDIDFIKIDAQGAGLEVLKGASSKLKNLIGIEIEVDFVPLYLNIPTFGEVDLFLRAHNFVLMDIKKVHWHRNSAGYMGKGDLIWGDALYFKDPAKVKELIAQDGSKLSKTILCYLAYGYYSLARDLAETFSIEIDDLMNENSLDLTNQWRTSDDCLGNIF